MTLTKRNLEGAEIAEYFLKIKRNCIKLILRGYGSFKKKNPKDMEDFIDFFAEKYNSLIN